VAVKKALGSEPGGAVAAVAAALLVLAAVAAAAGRGSPGSGGGPQTAEKIVLDPSPASRAIEPLLARLWDSGFFRHNDAVRLEILNNRYAFFGPGSPVPPKGSRGLGCFSHTPGARDIIFLRKNLFSHFEVGMEGTDLYKDVQERVLPVLVHEICHDLWTNVLDDRERAAFAREGEELIEEYCRAQTAAGQQLFLLRFGDDISSPRCRRSYAEIEDILTARLSRPLLAHEMFPWLAERLFMTKTMIPKPLRKYYSCILAGVLSADAEIIR